MKLIQLPTLDFEQKIQREIEENPALEQGQNSNDDDDQQENQDDFSDSEDINIDDYLDFNKSAVIFILHCEVFEIKMNTLKQL